MTLIKLIMANSVMFILRLAVCLTAQARIPSLRHHHVFQRFPDVGRNQDLHTPDLPFHLLGVDLTEVAVLVLHLHIPEHQSVKDNCVSVTKLLHDLIIPVGKPTGWFDFLRFEKKFVIFMSF